MLAIRESIDDAVRMHCAPKDTPDLPTAPASDLTTPNNVSDVDKSPHADVWQYSIENEFGGIPQASTFASAPA